MNLLLHFIWEIVFTFTLRCCSGHCFYDLGCICCRSWPGHPCKKTKQNKTNLINPLLSWLLLSVDFFFHIQTQVNTIPLSTSPAFFSPNSSLHASFTRPPKSPLYLLLSASCLHMSTLASSLEPLNVLCPSDVLVADPLVIAKEKPNIWISATLSPASCLLLSAAVSRPDHTLSPLAALLN